MSDTLARQALAAAPDFPKPGLWTPLSYPSDWRTVAAGDLATAIRKNAHMLNTEERARFATELLTPHSCDHAHDPRFEVS